MALCGREAHIACIRRLPATNGRVAQGICGAWRHPPRAYHGPQECRLARAEVGCSKGLDRASIITSRPVPFALPAPCAPRCGWIRCRFGAMGAQRGCVVGQAGTARERPALQGRWTPVCSKGRARASASPYHRPRRAPAGLRNTQTCTYCGHTPAIRCSGDASADRDGVVRGVWRLGAATRRWARSSGDSWRPARPRAEHDPQECAALLRRWSGVRKALRLSITSRHAPFCTCHLATCPLFHVSSSRAPAGTRASTFDAAIDHDDHEHPALCRLQQRPGDVRAGRTHVVQVCDRIWKGDSRCCRRHRARSSGDSWRSATPRAATQPARAMPLEGKGGVFERHRA